MQEPAAVQGFARLLDRLDLLAQLVIAGPTEKRQLYVSPALEQAQRRSEQPARQGSRDRAGRDEHGPGPMTSGSSRSERPKSRATLVTDLYYRPASRTTRALVALLSGVVVLLAGLAVAVWLAGRWMVAPLARLSAQVDKVAGGDLTIAVPRSRIGEIANIAQAVEGMTAALGETAQRRAEADEARRFLVTSVAHDLRTPLFALRGHLQAIGSRLGNPAVHLERAEARADALERLIGNLFAYTRDDYAQPAPQLEAVPVADLLQEVTAGLEHTTRLRDNTFELDGDRALAVIVDRDRFKRALTNILDNALRYSPAGAPVHLGWAAADESTVQITVQDHGPGIDPDLLPHIFEPGIRGTPAAGSPDRRGRARPHDRETPPRTPTRHPHGPQPTNRRRSHQARPSSEHSPPNAHRADAPEGRRRRRVTDQPPAFWSASLTFAGVSAPCDAGRHFCTARRTAGECTSMPWAWTISTVS